MTEGAERRLQVPYATLKVLPTHTDSFYRMVHADELVLTHVSITPLLRCMRQACGMNPETARAILRRWVCTGKVHVHPRVTDRAKRLRTLELCLRRARAEQSDVWSLVLATAVAPWVPVPASAGARVCLRVPVSLPRSLFVPTMLENARATGVLKGAYSTWGTSYSLLTPEREAMKSAGRTLMRRGKQLSFAIHAAQAAGRPEAKVSICIDVLDRVAAGTHAQDPGITSDMVTQARELMAMGGFMNAARALDS